MKNKLISYSIFPLLAIVISVWGADFEWDFEEIDRLELFPLFGLIAWITMWWHFFLGFVGRVDEDFKKNERLSLVSGYWVFASFILHPALLILFAQDAGYSILNGADSGRTPADFFNLFVGGDYVKFVYLGYFALVVFLAYDLARILHRTKFVKKYWMVIDALSDIAFAAIWIHSLALGSHLDEGWFRTFWTLLGLSGIAFIIYKHYFRYRSMKNSITAP